MLRLVECGPERPSETDGNSRDGAHGRSLLDSVGGLLRRRNNRSRLRRTGHRGNRWLQCLRSGKRHAADQALGNRNHGRDERQRQFGCVKRQDLAEPCNCDKHMCAHPRSSGGFRSLLLRVSYSSTFFFSLFPESSLSATMCGRPAAGTSAVVGLGFAGASGGGAGFFLSSAMERLRRAGRYTD